MIRDLKLWIPPVVVRDFDTFMALATRATVRTFDIRSSYYLTLECLVDGIHYKWHGRFYERKYLSFSKARGLHIVWQQLEFLDHSAPYKYWTYTENCKDIDDALKNPTKYVEELVERLRRKNPGYSREYLLRCWIQEQNKRKCEAASKVIEQRLNAFVEKLKLHGWIEGYLEQIDPRELFEPSEH